MRRHPADRVLATVLFTDIVGSTERAADLGDRRWRELVARHHAVVRAQLKRFRGREVDTAGDGFFAAFDRPAQAIQCALAIVDGLRPLGLAIRAGVHAGELEVASDRRLGGIAVHTAARVVATAGPGEIVVTATVRELVAGSDIEFEDRGTTTLKGVPGEWRLFAVVPPTAAEAPPPSPELAGTAAPRTGGRRSALWPVVAAVAVVVLIGMTVAVAAPRLFAPPVTPGPDTVARIDAAGNGFDLAVPVGTEPIGLATGGGAVWAISVDDATLSWLDAATGQERFRPAVGGAPTAIAYGADSVWVTTGYVLSSGEAGDVARYVPSLNRIENRIAVGAGADAIGFGEGSVWVANRISERLLRIDPGTNQVVHEMTVARGPVAVAVGLGSVWVASSLDGVVQRINPHSYGIVAEVPTGPATALAVADDYVWVTSETTDAVIRIDPTINTPATFQIGNGPRGIAVAGSNVWVALGLAGQVVQFDPAASRAASTLDVDGFPEAVALDDNERVWVAVSDP